MPLKPPVPTRLEALRTCMAMFREICAQKCFNFWPTGTCLTILKDSSAPLCILCRANVALKSFDDAKSFLDDEKLWDEIQAATTQTWGETLGRMGAPSPQVAVASTLHLFDSLEVPKDGNLGQLLTKIQERKGMES